MIAPTDRRYRIAGDVQTAPDRRGCYAWDLLAGDQVFIKTGPRSRILHEYSVLLQLPPGVSARVRDLLVVEDGCLALVQERLAGRTWPESPMDSFPAELPLLVIDLCERLVRLHRLGFSHTDLKPSNVLLLDHPAGQTRLIDLGSARSIALLHLSEEAAAATEVTAPYVAPELLRGWAADTRADQYSLGMILRRMPGRIIAHPEWTAIIDRLTQPAPSRRYADLTQLQEEIQSRFALPQPVPQPPSFGAGAMHGRGAELADLVEWATGPPGPPLLVVQAQPGVGLTRFLREGVAAVIAAGGPPTRFVECPRVKAVEGSPNNPADSLTADGLAANVLTADALAAVALAAGYLEDGARVVLGVPDPSPALAWTSGPGAERLRCLLDRPGVRRLFLRSVNETALQNIVAASLGGGGSATDALGSALHARTEGDLCAAAQGFAEVCARAGAAKGVRWALDASGAAAATDACAIPVLQPRVTDLPSDLQEPARILARAGLIVPTAAAGRLLSHFGDPAALDRLRAWGAVYDLPGDQVRFLHNRLRMDAQSRAPAAGEAVDRWLCRFAEPNLRDPLQVREAAARARALADRILEGDYLRRSLDLAVAERRWSDARPVLEYPSGSWSESDALPRAADLHRMLGETWPPIRILHLMGRCLLAQGDPLGAKLLARAAEAPDTADGYESLALLASTHGGAGRVEEFLRILERIDAVAAGGVEPVPGLAALAAAQRCILQGKRVEAREHVARAAEKLRGSGLPQESELYMFAAAVSMPDHPAAAIAWLERGLEEIPVPFQRSALHRILAGVHEFRGDPVEFERNAQAAIDDLGDDEYPRHRIFLRAQRAWAWVHRDRARDAQAEATDLLQSPILQRDPQRMLFTTILAGCAALQQGHGRTAVARFAAAWEALDPKLPAGRRAPVLRYFLDALLDLRAWPVIREHAASLTLPPDSPEMAATLTATRAEALQAQAGGSDAEAHALLAAHTDEARGHPGLLDGVRYLHHQAEAAVSLDPGSAIVLYGEALNRLPAAGYGYLRARSMLGLARAHDAIHRPEARRLLDEVVGQARRIDARGVLADALQLRAEWGLPGS